MENTSQRDAKLKNFDLEQSQRTRVSAYVNTDFGFNDPDLENFKNADAGYKKCKFLYNTSHNSYKFDKKYSVVLQNVGIFRILFKADPNRWKSSAPAVMVDFLVALNQCDAQWELELLIKAICYTDGSEKLFHDHDKDEFLHFIRKNYDGVWLTEMYGKDGDKPREKQRMVMNRKFFQDKEQNLKSGVGAPFLDTNFASKILAVLCKEKIIKMETHHSCLFDLSLNDKIVTELRFSLGENGLKRLQQVEKRNGLCDNTVRRLAVTHQSIQYWHCSRRFCEECCQAFYYMRSSLFYMVSEKSDTDMAQAIIHVCQTCVEKKGKCFCYLVPCSIHSALNAVPLK